MKEKEKRERQFSLPSWPQRKHCLVSSHSSFLFFLSSRCSGQADLITAAGAAVGGAVAAGAGEPTGSQCPVMASVPQAIQLSTKTCWLDIIGYSVTLESFWPTQFQSSTPSLLFLKSRLFHSLFHLADSSTS